MDCSEIETALSSTASKCTLLGTYMFFPSFILYICFLLAFTCNICTVYVCYVGNVQIL